MDKTIVNKSKRASEFLATSKNTSVLRSNLKQVLVNRWKERRRSTQDEMRNIQTLDPVLNKILITVEDRDTYSAEEIDQLLDRIENELESTDNIEAENIEAEIESAVGNLLSCQICGSMFNPLDQNGDICQNCFLSKFSNDFC